MASRCATTGRPVQFYRPTRAQAPKYAKHPALAHSFECSICRGLFLDDSPEERRAHRFAHAAPLDGRRCGALECGTFTTPCRDCGEDVCADFRCQAHHKGLCADYAAAWAMIDAGREAEGEALLDALAVRDR